MKKAWTGTLKLGFVLQPVAVYAAADSKAKNVAFNQLHEACGGRLNQQLICKTCDVVVDRADVQRGFEHSKGQYVVITDAELDSAKVENTKVIDLQEFVPVADITPLHITESAFIAPVDPALAEAYVLIREALQGVAGIGTLNHGNKEKLVAVVAVGSGLILHTLRHASELRDMSDVPTLDTLPKTADPKTVKMMRALMASMQSSALDLSKYPNTYVENVQGLIAAKVAGHVVPTPVVPKATAVPNLADLLAASIKAKKASKKAA